MNIVKTPHELMLEQAGIDPYSPGLVKSPRQMLYEKAKLPRFEDGGEVDELSPAAMRAQMQMEQENMAPAQQEEEEPVEEQPTEEEPVEEETPPLQNQQLFEQLKSVVENPGKMPPSSIDPKMANLLSQVFGPNIFSAEQESQ